ncbi:MAG: alpha/beta fold hydrolase [Candidatus Limnocylindrales bacterium]
MPEEPISLPVARPPLERAAPARPIRKDEIDLFDRGVHIESWLPERRSRRRPLLFIHGELGGSWVWHRYQEYFAGRGWEAHALNLRAHYWSDNADFEELDFATYLADAESAHTRLGGHAVVVGHGLGGLLALKLAERQPMAALVLISPALPQELRMPAKRHQLREVPAVFRRDYIGWQGLPEQIRRQNPDLSIGDVLRIQHMMGAESGTARRDVLSGVSVDPAELLVTPRLVIGGGLDRLYPEHESERLAEWLGAEYLPFGAHSHYGLVAGDDSHAQVAAALKAFLEAHHL